MKLQKKLTALLLLLSLLPAAVALIFWGDLQERVRQPEFLLWLLLFLALQFLLCYWISKKMINTWRATIQRDFLTHLFNKGETEVRARQRLMTGIGQAMVIVDIDNFKRINDTLGHQYGDVVLRTAAERMKSVFSGNDFVGRIGGDEFLIFVQGPCASEELTQRLERLNGLFLQPVDGGECVSRVSISMGAACRVQEEETYDTLFNRADRALYEAKREGKGRYRISPEPKELASQSE